VGGCLLQLSQCCGGVAAAVLRVVLLSSALHVGSCFASSTVGRFLLLSLDLQVWLCSYMLLPGKRVLQTGAHLHCLGCCLVMPHSGQEFALVACLCATLCKHL
jgi:hypothetical protein